VEFKWIQVVAQNSRLVDEHLLPMAQVTQKQSGALLMQVFNFVDTLGGKPNLTAAGTLFDLSPF